LLRCDSSIDWKYGLAYLLGYFFLSRMHGSFEVSKKTIRKVIRG
jgi:hypothetical protein